MKWLLIVVILNVKGGVEIKERTFFEEFECVQAANIYRKSDDFLGRVNAGCVQITTR